MNLSDMKPGDVAEITGYSLGSSSYRAKWLALGLTRCVKIKIINVAPLGDPVELAVRGYHLSLRKDEAKVIKIKLMTKDELLGK